MPQSSRPKPQIPSRSGFTLVEILVVVVILGIAGAVVVPHMLDPGSMTVQGAARMIIGDLLMAQNEAIARHQPHKVVFHAADNSYVLTDEAGNVLDWPGADRAREMDFDEDGRFAGVRIEAVDIGGGSAVAFGELGGPESGGTIDIAAGEFKYRIRVAPFTGRVTVAPLEE